MTEQEILTLARELMDQHGLQQWNLTLSRAKTQAGCTYPSRRQITLSRLLLPKFSPDQVRDVILHEIAHALAGPRQGHGPAWQKLARQLGATPQARLNLPQPVLESSWVGTCPGCGLQVHRHGTPRRVRSCARCSPQFDLDYVFDWQFRGARKVPGGQYVRELTAIRRRRPS
ncbi:SprT-like domain-containing protein [Scrofimicrobium sp. R131]|uniref:SprT-like domain-containing protein n=1 Tax=Scrofimicrobium appendicitidis TaxID=3079930 RepID=A0AAU7V9J6_9ACTO